MLTHNDVQLVAAIPTDAYFAWTWVESDPRVDRPSDHTSAKVCFFRGHFSYVPDPGPNPTAGETIAPVRGPFYADIQEPNGLGMSSMLPSVPKGAIRELKLHPYVGRVTHWAPW